MAMNPFDNAKVMGELWGRGTQSFLDAQRGMFETMSRSAPPTMAPGPMPDTASFQAAQSAFQQAWANAQSVSSAFAEAVAGQEAATADPVAAALMTKIFDPRGWLSATSEIDEAVNRMAEGPRLADLWSVERKFARLTAAWLALRGRNLEHNTVMLEAWSKAAGLFSQTVNERAEAGEPLDSARAMMDLWVETANDVLLDTQRTESFLKTQRETLKASTELRLAQQEIGEFYGEMFGYPTRAELDDVHKTVTELRREVRALSRAARAAKDEPKAAGPKLKPAAPKSKASASKAGSAVKTGARGKGAPKTEGRSS